MRTRLAQRRMAFALVALACFAGVSWWLQGPPTHRSALNHFVWMTFLFGLPLVLAAAALIGARWSLIVGVMYGTIGLALDISTIIQELSRADEATVALWLSVITGLVNALIITIGGHGFLDVGPATPLPVSPPANPPSPSSKESL